MDGAVRQVVLGPVLPRPALCLLSLRSARLPVRAAELIWPSSPFLPSSTTVTSCGWSERAWWTDADARSATFTCRVLRSGERSLAATAAATDGKSTKEMLDRRAAVYFGRGGEGEAEGGNGEELRLSPAA